MLKYQIVSVKSLRTCTSIDFHVLKYDKIILTETILCFKDKWLVNLDFPYVTVTSEQTAMYVEIFNLSKTEAFRLLYGVE